jgi:hypothetical protein
MSSETDHPRQRTVAELLAQHGDVTATGRRRRRREPDGSDEGAAAPVGSSAPAAPDRPAPPGGRRRADREPAPRDVERPSWENGRTPEPQAWDSGPQAWAPSEWDAPARDGRWESRPGPGPQPEREQRGWEPEPPGPEPRAWEPRPWEPQPQEPTAQPRAWEPQQTQAREPRPRDAQPQAAAAAGPVRERPTDHIPRIHDNAPPQDVNLTGPIQPHHRRGADGYEAVGYDADGYEADGYEAAGYEADGYGHDDGDEGPPTMIGAAPVGAEAWHSDRTRGRRGAAPADDGGPPTEAAAPLEFDDDHPAGLGGRGYDDSDGFEDFYGGGQDGPPPVHRPVRSRNDRPRGDRDQRFGGADPEPNGFFDSTESEPVEGEAEQPGRRRRLTGAVAESASQAWAAVLAQWIAGAVGGAALWVGFRFLWRSLPVVALAAAVLVTVGLVVVVRALLRNDDMRTTLFAVLVGLLLTVSPAILVLLGR